MSTKAWLFTSGTLASHYACMLNLRFKCRVTFHCGRLMCCSHASCWKTLRMKETWLSRLLYPFYGGCHEWHHMKKQPGMKYDGARHWVPTNDHDLSLGFWCCVFYLIILSIFLPSFFILKLPSRCTSWRLSRWSYCLWISIPRRVLRKSKKGIYQCEVRTGTKRK